GTVGGGGGLLARSLKVRYEGIAIASRIPMMMTTTRSSMSVKPDSSRARRLAILDLTFGSPSGRGDLVRAMAPHVSARLTAASPLDQAIHASRKRRFVQRVKVGCRAADERDEACRTRSPSTTCS